MRMALASTQRCSLEQSASVAHRVSPTFKADEPHASKKPRAKAMGLVFIEGALGEQALDARHLVTLLMLASTLKVHLWSDGTSPCAFRPQVPIRHAEIFAACREPVRVDPFADPDFTAHPGLLFNC